MWVFHHAAPEPLLLESTRWLLPTALIMLGLSTGCAGSLPRITSDTLRVNIDALEYRDASVVIDLAMRNLRDRPLHYEYLDLELTLDGEKLVGTRHHEPFTLATRSREIVKVDSSAEAAGLQRLEALGSGDLPAMPWTLQLTLIDDRGREREIEYEGWLHRVPGQENRFR